MYGQAVDYRPMWERLGLDLEAHDALLSAVGPLYADAYLSQQDRPEGMSYFDFVISEIHGLRIKELDDFRSQGGKVVGTFCLYVPEEIVRAAGATARCSAEEQHLQARRGQEVRLWVDSPQCCDTHDA